MGKIIDGLILRSLLDQIILRFWQCPQTALVSHIYVGSNLPNKYLDQFMCRFQPVRIPRLFSKDLN